MDVKTPFMLYPTCQPTMGKTRSLICDLERQKYFLIPNILFEILTNKELNTISDVLIQYAGDDNKNTDTILEYFDYLIQNDLILFSQNRSYYAEPEMAYFYPGYISNCIIDVGDSSFSNVILTIRQMDELFCRSLQIRAYCNLSLNQLEVINSECEGTVLEWIEIIMPFNNNISIDELIKICIGNERLRLLVLYGYTQDEIIWQHPGRCRITGITQIIDSNKHCGVVNSAYFSPNLATVSESKNFNSCLNLKVGIDVKGFIKNCPSLEKIYGHISSVKIIDAIKSNEFRDMWSINKEVVYKCKECEFRYICTDCRAYLEDPKDIYSKPLKCGYDPESGQWSDWSTNPLKNDAIKFYDIIV